MNAVRYGSIVTASLGRHEKKKIFVLEARFFN